MLLPTLDKSCLVSKLTLSTKSSHQPLHIVWKQTFEEYDVADAEKNEIDDEVEWGAPKSKVVLICLKLWPKVIIEDNMRVENARVTHFTKVHNI